MLNYEKKQELLNNAPQVEKGAIIKCKGITSTIDTIYYSDIYLQDDKICYDVEFRDTKGIVRNWKSKYDKGLIFNEKTSNKQIEELNKQIEELNKQVEELLKEELIDLEKLDKIRVLENKVKLLKWYDTSKQIEL